MTTWVIHLRRPERYDVVVRSGMPRARVVWATLPATSIASARALIPRGSHGLRWDGAPRADGLLEEWRPWRQA